MTTLYEDLKWQAIVPELGEDSPQIAILRVDPSTKATQLLIRTPRKVHVPMHWHSANETHTIIQGTATFEILAGMLQRILRTEVAYETGIGGVFRFSLSWPEDNSDSVIRALRDAGIELSKEYRDGNVLVVYSAFWPDAPQPPQHSCGPGPSVRSAIESLPRSIEAATPVDERMEPVRKLLEEYPQNLFVEMAAQDLFFDQPGFTVWRGRALSRYRGMQDQTGGAFLQARLQSYLEPKDSLNILEAILQKEPAFPSAHLLAAALSRPGVAKNKHLAGFRQLCTGSLEDAALYGDVRDPELLRLAVAAFTRTLGGAPIVKRCSPIRTTGACAAEPGRSGPRIGFNLNSRAFGGWAVLTIAPGWLP